MLKRIMREGNRTPVLNDKFEILTLQEIIEWIMLLNKEHKRVVQRDSKYPVGLYIELKDYTDNLKYTGIDMAEKMNSILTHYGINTVSTCTYKMPIIVQAF
jgi:hypothetical protein